MANVNKLDETITKSLDDLEAMAEKVKKSTAENEEALSKGLDNEDVAPEEVSEDAPEQGNEEAPEEGAPEGGDEPQEDGDVDADTEAEEDANEDEPVEKSLEDTLKSNDGVRKALEVSEFLDELVKGLSTVLTGHSDELQKSIDSTNKSNEIIAKSMIGIVKSHQTILDSQTSLSKSINDLAQRMMKVETTPVVRKSVPSAQTKVIQKSFEASNGDAPKQEEGISKSMAIGKLMSAVQGGQGDLSMDVLALESGANISDLSANAKLLLGSNN
ncbi:hypothetical protein SHANETTE_93 [Bacillus phage Shanette]|uniref:Uncharacterized protein n=1 Tax=Bacillus phage Shanette TaxID=1296656 RepID=S5MTA1_9CAUD|nr:head scaffolding protein [Bacillus phage Shanette]AGR46987.1 hypothetical protein SHANETTE_93 [Bacillus phage Shanette]